MDTRKPTLDSVPMMLFHDYDNIGPVKQLFEQHGSGALVGPGGIHVEPGIALINRFRSCAAHPVYRANKQYSQWLVHEKER